MASIDGSNAAALVLLVVVAAALLGRMVIGSARRGGAADPGARRGASRRRPAPRTLAALQAERDALRAKHAVEIAALEGRLADATARAQEGLAARARLGELEGGNAGAGEDQLVTLRGEAAGERDRLAEVVAERDAARQQIAVLEHAVAELRAEIAARDSRTEEGPQEAPAGGEAAAGTVARLQAREAELSAALQAREEALEEMRIALAAAEEARAAAPDPQALERLRQDLDAALQRESTANESLSRLAYDRDGLRNMITSFERAEREARAQAERHAALLELRLQKIHELEARLREQDEQLLDEQRRAACAQEAASAGAAGEASADGATLAEGQARSEELQAALATAKAENAALVEEVETLRRGAVEAGVAVGAAGDDAVRARLAELEAENARLRAAAQQSGFDRDEVDALKARLRDLATRFVESAAHDAAIDDDGPGATLADRIRAFKAARERQGTGRSAG